MTDMKLKESLCDRGTFTAAYGGVYEHSPWVAETAWNQRTGASIDTLESLRTMMRDVVEQGSEAQQMTLICAHPDLAGKAAVAGNLTKESRSEQSGAGLDQCTPDEFDEFQTLNAAYKTKFGFPFIIAVKGHDRHSILAAFRARLNHDREREFRTALDEIHKIAGFRLADLT